MRGKIPPARFQLAPCKSWTGSAFLLVDSTIETYQPGREKHSCMIRIRPHVLSYNYPLLNIDEHDGKFDDLMWEIIALVMIARGFEIHDCDEFEMLLDHRHRIVASEHQLRFVVVLQTKSTNLDLPTSDAKAINDTESKSTRGNLVGSCRLVSSRSSCAGVIRLTIPLYLLRRFWQP